MTSGHERLGGVPPPGLGIPLEHTIPVAFHGAVERPFYATAKRLFDVVVSALSLLVLSPLLLLIAIAIKLHSPGPAIFVQERIGFDPRTGTVRPFPFYKFRSMRHDNDDSLHRAHVAKLIEQNTAVAPGEKSLKLERDPRITGLGHILRKTSLDELPQLFNVLEGTMSLVGPRPALPYEVALYDERHRQRLLAVPGVTGWWQVRGRSRVSFDEAVEMDIWYIEHASLGLDLKILLLTPWAVASGQGAG
jgi:lipopolysaccharide/colanic/teichoic acid biosynthesis glycosyltransferase